MNYTKTAYFYLSDKELRFLDRKAKTRKLSRSDYLRKRLREVEMTPTPEIDFEGYISRLKVASEKARTVADKLWHNVSFDVPLLVESVNEATEVALGVQKEILKEMERLNAEKEQQNICKINRGRL
ncbi:MAG: hypothetical protein UHM85_09635 [Acutalibacteraceae bacterium]|nr:hypothetical protein [Acutalibacteraceae bacterium]